jgi:hypothetical protein
MSVDQPSFLQVVIQNVRAIPRHSWLLAIAASALLAAPDLLEWHDKAGTQPLKWGIVAAGSAAWLAATYGGITVIIARPASLAGSLRFFLTAMVLGLPFLAFFVGALLLIGKLGGQLMVIAMMLWMPVLLLLPAWPVAAGLLPGIVSPLRLFRATRGHRWGLVMAGFLASAPSKMVSDLGPATTSGVAGFHWLLDTGASVLTLALATSTAATAWLYAVSNDPGLEPETP